MKKHIILLLIFTLLSSLSLSFGANIDTICESYILVDYDSMTVLDGKEMHKPLYPASTTKVMTAILALEHGDLDSIVTVDQEIVSLAYGSHIALEPGEKFTLNDMLYALLLPSANDAALAIAKHISGSIDEFVVLMNEKAKELGAENTNFVNPHGLHDDNHVTTAYDLSLFAKYAMEIPKFREYVNTTEYTIAATEIKGEPRYLYTTNRLLRSSQTIEYKGNTIPITYEGASGVKTGYTTEASNCLISFAERDGQALLAVVLKSQAGEVYLDTHKLLNHGFENFDNVKIGSQNEFIGNFDIKNGEIPLTGGILESDTVITMNGTEVDTLDKEINLRSNLEAPVKEGEIIGTMSYYIDGEFVGESNILSTMDIEAVASNSILSLIQNRWYLLAIIVVLILLIVRVRFVSNRRRRRRKRSSSLYV